MKLNCLLSGYNKRFICIYYTLNFMFCQETEMNTKKFFQEHVTQLLLLTQRRDVCL